MRFRISTILAAALLCLAPTASWADLAPYSQEFEGLVPAPQNLPDTSLGDDGWLVFANVFTADWNYLYGYGVFPAPNTGAAFSAVVSGEGGPPQGVQQLSVFSDYNNGDHGNNRFIEANVFQEQIVGAADVGSTWLFEFDAKRGNIEGQTTALAFFKTLNPAAGFALTNFITADMTNIPDAWGSYSLSIFIDPSLVGQILQFGFLSTATGFQGSGIYYDNVNFGLAPLSVGIEIKPGGFPNSINLRSRGVIPVAILGSANFDVTDVDVTTLRFGPNAAGPAHNLTDSFTYNDHLQDVNFDEYMDLVSHYRTQNTGIACGDESAMLTGETLDGQPFEGSDSISTVGCGLGRPGLRMRGDRRMVKPVGGDVIDVERK